MTRLFRLACLGPFLLSPALPSPARAAGPGLEYGPEAEARFLSACEAGADPVACRCLLRGLEDALGYEQFLAVAGAGPAALAASPEPRLGAALRQAGQSCPDTRAPGAAG
ncbi:hypothetical protein [Roseomonas sp. BN140053]|uniref:hypothetical protein n=1 Tax=Roseomonas sp. BN140053 TaxID=3391898 RepID=UPI0039EB1E10